MFEDLSVDDEACKKLAYQPVRKSGPGSAWGTLRLYCCVLNCTSCTLSCPNLWFFKLPAHSKERRQEWLKQIGRAGIQLYYRLLVCEKHFDPADIHGSSHATRRFIKSTAHPTLFLPNSCSETPVSTNPKHAYEGNNSEIKVYKRMKKSNPDEELVTKIKLENIDRDDGDDNSMSKDNEELPHLSSHDGTSGYKTVDSFIKLYTKFKDKTETSKKIYSNEYKIKVLLLYNENTQLYKALQSTFHLPPISILPSFIPSTLVRKNVVFLTSLEGKISHLPLKHKYASLCMNIMQIHPYVQFDCKMDDLFGVCGSNNVAPAQYAVLAMVRGIAYDWHHYASSFFMSSLDTVTGFNTWFENLIITMSEMGLCIKAVVTSTDDFFINALEILQPFMFKKKIYTVFDPLHLMLLLYDELKEYSVSFEQPKNIKKFIAKWEHISKFYDHDSKRKFRLTNSSSDINPNDLQQNKLNAAAQILSLSTATGLSIFVDLKVLDKTAMETVDFLVRMNNIFAALYPNALKSEEKPLPAQKGDNSWGKNIKFLESIMCINNAAEVKSNVKFVNCFITSIENIALMQETLSLKSFASVMTRYLNQNPLLELIHKINTKSYKHKYPTTNELLEVIDDTFMRNDFHNMRSEVNVMENFIENANKVIEQDSNIEEANQTLCMCSDLEDDYTQIDREDASTILYVATYILNKMCNKYKNAVCSRMTIMASRVHYENKNADISGSLIIPDNDFLQFVYNMDSVFVSYCKLTMATGRFYVEMMKQINKHIVTSPFDGKPLEYIKSLFINLRMYHTIINNNDIYEKDEATKEFVVKRLIS